MATIRGPARAFLALGSALLFLTGCDKLSGHGEKASDWARAALERNGQLTIVAFDENENAFTVKMKETGELHVVRADQVVGGVPGAPGEAQPKPVSETATANGETTASAAAAPVDPEPAAAGEVARPADAAGARLPGAAASGTGVITDPRTGSVLASSGSAAQAAAAQNAGASAPAADANGKKVLASGPGYSIKAGDPAPASAARTAPRAAAIPSPARGVAVERRYEPMICQGQRLLRIDGRNMEFEGDALRAQDGCEIHITNSHIIAHGVGVSARAANVHIKNSVIEGDSGSISASQGAQVYTQQSTFKGLSRRLDTASFHDLGGTVWN